MDTGTRQRSVSYRAKRIIAVLMLAAVLAAPSHAENVFDHTHSAFTTILATHVTGGRVDYRTLKAAPRELRGYLDGQAVVSKQQFHTFTQEQQLAFLFNLYNAATLKLIIDHYPVTSIKDIGNWFRGPWDQPIIRLFGEKVTLNTLEHDILRADYNEPRLHMALVCAAQGCPPLRSEAYIAKKLDSQLDDQTRIFLNSLQGMRIDRSKRTVYVSKIFKWYGDDFIKAYTPRTGFSGLGRTERAVAGFCSQYISDQDRAYMEAGGYKIKYLDYNWSLNEQRVQK